MRIRTLEGLRRLDQLLAGKKATNPKIWLFLMPLFFWFNWLCFASYFGEDVAQSVLFCLTLPTVHMVLWLALAPAIARRSGRLSPMLLLGLTALSQLASEFLKFEWLGISWQPEPDKPFAIQVVFTSIVIALAWMFLMLLTVEWFEASRARLGRLRAVRADLAGLRSQLSMRLTTDLQLLRAQIAESLAPTIEQLRARLEVARSSQNLLGLAQDIRSFCDREVRELSHQISSGAEEAQPIRRGGRQGLFATSAQVFRRGNVSLEFVAGMLLLLAAPYAINVAGYQTLILVVVGIGLGYLVARPIERLRRRLVSGSPAVVSFFSGIVMLVCVSELGLVAVRLLEPLYPNLAGFIDLLWFLLPIMLVFIWVVAGWTFGARDLLRASELELAESNTALEIENRRLRQQASAARARLYRLLHGSVQGRLAAVSLALTALANDDTPARSGELLEQAQEQLAAAERELAGAFDEQPEQTGIDEQWSELQSRWRNLIAISMSASDSAWQALAADPSLAREVMAALQEGITNAYRHARADRLEIALVANDDELNLTMTNPVGTDSPAASPQAAEQPTDGTGIERIALGAYAVKFDRGQGSATLTATWKF